jgi:hypothetical protein
MGWEIAVALIGAGASVGAAAAAPKPPKPPDKPGPPPAPAEEGPEAGKKVKKYKSPAQLFKDEDLRLGGAGKLGM